MSAFVSGSELIAAFGDIGSHNFYDPVSLKDSVGFSIKKNYPTGIRFKPAIRQDSSDPDSVAVIWVVYESDLAKKQPSGHLRVPLRIRIALMSLYRARHWDYDFSDKEGGCPSRESLEASLESPKPIELSFEGDYFYDHGLSALVGRNGQELSGADVLRQVFEKHCNTVHLLRGLQLRLKLAWQSKFSGLLGLVVSALTYILKMAFGRTIESSETLAGLYEPYERESFKKLDQDSVDLLGYKASKHVIILFCALIIIGSIYRFNNPSSSDYLAWLDGKELVSVAHAIFLIWLIDVAIPWGLFLTINFMIVLNRKIMFLQFRVK